jgi:heme a synthase
MQGPHPAAISDIPLTRALKYPRFARYAWGVLLYTLLVIAFGAWVRITGSGAGCGEHWPSCNGEVIPRSPTVATVIEYTHRVTSGLLGPLVLGLVAWAHWGAGRRRAVRVVAYLTLLLVVVEALLGAGLVKGGLVAENSSLARALVVALHLGNTLLLTAVTALVAWLGAGREIKSERSGEGAKVLLGLVLVALVSMAGAVTALGDTLFPVSPTADGGMFARVRDGLDMGSHFLVRLRAVHPVLATALALWLLWASSEWMTRAAPGSDARRLAQVLHYGLWLQLLCGFSNVMLAAPSALQLLHLLLAQGVWLSLVLLFSVARDLRPAGEAIA